jgi:hypothetical protein
MDIHILNNSGAYIHSLHLQPQHQLQHQHQHFSHYFRCIRFITFFTIYIALLMQTVMVTNLPNSIISTQKCYL